jgi:hypothetical protein
MAPQTWKFGGPETSDATVCQMRASTILVSDSSDNEIISSCVSYSALERRRRSHVDSENQLE